MTADRRFEHDLPGLLEHLAQPATPDYRDHVVQQTARMRQRPAWMFPERLLPMSAVTSRAAWIPRVPLRLVGVVALLLIALVVGLIVAGGPAQRLPAPFGRAGNGLVAYTADGNIFAADPVTGVPVAISSSPGVERDPVWSRDGSHIAFLHFMPTGDVQIFVARADGRDVVAVNPTPLREVVAYHSFSPDGREIAFTIGREGSRQLWIAKSDGSGIRQLDVGMAVEEPVYLPPVGDEILFVGAGPGVTGLAQDRDFRSGGLYAVSVETGDVRVVLEPSPGIARGVVRISPDGSRVAFSASTIDPQATQNTYRVHVVTTDGAGSDLILPLPDGAFFDDGPAWSNDGTRLAITRGYAPWDQEMVLAIVPADGSGTGIESARRITACCANAYEWAPDDSVILMTPIGFDNQRPLAQILVDAKSGATRPAPWTTSTGPFNAWQRRAP